MARRKKQMDLNELRSLGGKARAQRLTPEERKKIASKGGKAAKRARRKKRREEKLNKTGTNKEKG